MLKKFCGILFFLKTNFIYKNDKRDYLTKLNFQKVNSEFIIKL